MLKNNEINWYVLVACLCSYNIITHGLNNDGFSTALHITIGCMATIYTLDKLIISKPEILEGKVTSLGTVSVGNSYNCKLVPYDPNIEYLSGEIVSGKLVKDDLGKFEFHVIKIDKEKDIIVHNLIM